MKITQFRKKLPINSWIFIFYILLGIYAYASANRVINETFILVSIIGILDGLHFFITTRHIKIELETEESVEKGMDFALQIGLINSFYLPTPYIYLIPQEGKRVNLKNRHSIGTMLGRKEQVKVCIIYHSNLCGLETIQLEKVVLRSFFYFFRKEQKVSSEAKVKILPEVRALEYMHHFTNFLVEITDGKGKAGSDEILSGMGDEVSYDLRPYVQGDSQRLIHWKIAAYKNELLVRQRQGEHEYKSDIFFILNPFLSVEDEEESVVQDKLLTSFISLVGYYLNRNQKVRVAYYKDQDWRYIKLKELSQLHSLQENLGDYQSLKIEETMNQHSIIKKFIQITHHRGGVKVIVSAYWNKEMERYIMEGQSEKNVPCIWTRTELSEWMIKESELPVWHMTDEYELILSSEERFSLEELKQKSKNQIKEA